MQGRTNIWIWRLYADLLDHKWCAVEHSSTGNMMYSRGCVSCDLCIYLNTDTDIHGDDEDSVKMGENVPLSDKYTWIIIKEGKCEEVTQYQGESQVQASQHGKYVHLSKPETINFVLVDTMRAGIWMNMNFK